MELVGTSSRNSSTLHYDLIAGRIVTSSLSSRLGWPGRPTRAWADEFRNTAYEGGRLTRHKDAFKDLKVRAIVTITRLHTQGQKLRWCSQSDEHSRVVRQRCQHLRPAPSQPCITRRSRKTELHGRTLRWHPSESESVSTIGYASASSEGYFAGTAQRNYIDRLRAPTSHSG